MYTKKGTKPLEDIRVEVVKVNTYLVDGKSIDEDEKTGLKVRLSKNLDNYTDEAGNTCYLRKGEAPSDTLTEHRGITQLKSGPYGGQYVITQEILKAGEKRRNSLRRAVLVTDEQALDYVIFAERLDLLERPRFALLKALYNRQTAPRDWENIDPPESAEKHFIGKEENNNGQRENK